MSKIDSTSLHPILPKKMIADYTTIRRPSPDYRRNIRIHFGAAINTRTGDRVRSFPIAEKTAKLWYGIEDHAQFFDRGDRSHT
jgi:hypothetical protein